MKKVTLKSIEVDIIRASLCEEATYPGEYARQLLNLARIGIIVRNELKPCIKHLGSHLFKKKS